MNKKEFDFLVKLLKEKSGWDMDERHYFILDRKITSFVREKGYLSTAELIQDIKVGHKVLIAQILEALANSETFFNRDCDIFYEFEHKILPMLRETNRASKSIRVLSLGCSSGQEAYSVAMAIKRQFPDINNWDINIIALDFITNAIRKAQRGEYNTFEIQTGLNIKDIRENFNYDGENWIVKDDIKKMVEFRKHNILEKFVTVKSFDVVFCRNVLKYFLPQFQKDILENVIKVQADGGLFYLGKNEPAAYVEEFYNKIDGFDCLYRLKGEQTSDQLIEDVLTMQTKVMPKFVKPMDVKEQHKLIASILKK